MHLIVTYYLDVISSWCFWSEPAWAELKKRHADRVQFQWKIALLDKTGLPLSRAQEEWFYRRSGTIMRSPFMLSSAWYDEPIRAEYLAPNCVAEAAKDFGLTDDRVRLALAYAGLRAGKWFSECDDAAEGGARAANLNATDLLERARSPEIENRVRADTAAFHALQVTQRPTFVLDSEIGDRAVFSGFARIAPLATALESMVDDADAYISFAAHFGQPPGS
ncbi:MAG: disulfide bond formation protein DsbA [Verrucomicrobia bacterium]|nr:MAG: disulfide bond formation protein DsbA [Verrucomicrobiota bacterium]